MGVECARFASNLINFRSVIAPYVIVSCQGSIVMFIPTCNIVNLIAKLESMKLLLLNANNQVAKEICSFLRMRIISWGNRLTTSDLQWEGWEVGMWKEILPVVQECRAIEGYVWEVVLILWLIQYDLLI